MKIALISSVESVSYQFYSMSMQSINSHDNCYFEPILGSSIDYSNYDVALFMGGSNDAVHAKKINSNIICGIVDPRLLSVDQFKGIDILIVNGIESQVFFNANNLTSFVYPVYPDVPSAITNKSINEDGLILGYHGNKVHLEGMFPRITDAIKRLNKEVPIRLFAMYNIKDLGESKLITSDKLGFPVKHIQYSFANYAKYISISDIGLAPQFLNTRLERFVSYLYKMMRRDGYNYFLSYKATTNLGRHFVFCQYGIPVVSDATPSAADFIINGENGFLSYSTDSWFNALQRLSQNEQLRKEIGRKGFITWNSKYTHDNLNNKLLDFLKVNFK